MVKLIAKLHINITLTALLAFGVSLNAQKIFSDKKDPFSGDRIISTDNVKLIPPLFEAGTSATINASGKFFYISFISTAFAGLNIQSADTVKKECLIKLANGEIINGSWKGDAEMPIGAKYYTSSTFIFSEEDYKKLSAGLTTYIKITGVKISGLFEIKDKYQGNMGRLCMILLGAL